MATVMSEEKTQVSGMFLMTLQLTGNGPLLYSQPVHEDKRDDETHEQKEARTWEKKACVNEDGQLYIPASAVKGSMVFAGRWLSMKLTGKKTYTKRIESGVLTIEPHFLLTGPTGKPLRREDYSAYPLYVPSDGRTGGTRRVWKTFPRVSAGWVATGSLLITDESLTQEALRKHLSCAGIHDGMGAMRIGKGGQNGMYIPEILALEPYEF